LFILLIVTILILINALYVAAEFSSVSARRSRLAQMREDGNRMAGLILPILEDPRRLDNYIATCQLGITASSLLLGFYGQGSVARAISPALVRYGGLTEVLAASISATGVLLFLTLLQALLGELVPKNIGIQYPERLALSTVLPVSWSMTLFRPLIWFFNGSGQLLMRLLGLTPVSDGAHIHAPEEIILLVEESSAGGLLDKEERRLLENTLQLRESMVRQVMIPRTRVFAASMKESCETLMSLLADSNYSRLPLYDESMDEIVGVVHLRDLLCLTQGGGCGAVQEIMRPVLFVPETMLVREVFTLLQRNQYHVAVVLDEFGGTAGIVTLEDLIEEIFGDLQDEFDPVYPQFRLLPDNRLVVRGDTLVRDLNEWLDIVLPSYEVDTIGGLVLSKLGHVPDVGEKIRLEDLILRVESMDGKAVSTVSLQVTSKQVQRLREMVS
jgi:CBS domain containing-hemolysin-like protein